MEAKTGRMELCLLEIPAQCSIGKFWLLHSGLQFLLTIELFLKLLIANFVVDDWTTVFTAAESFFRTEQIDFVNRSFSLLTQHS